MDDMRMVIARMAEEENIWVDGTWNWFESGKRTRFALVELAHGPTLQVPSVYLSYCADESELMRMYDQQARPLELPGRRTFMAVMAGHRTPVSLWG